MGIQQLTSRPWPHQSITTRSNFLLLRYFLKTLSAAPTLVQHNTLASSRISVMTCSCNPLIYVRICLISPQISLRSDLTLVLFSFFCAEFSFFYSAFHCPSLFPTRKSRHLSITSLIIRAGLPTRTQLTLRQIPSTILSTAILDGAHAKTFCPLLTACTISSHTVVVLPVPGGPWIRWHSWVSPFPIAIFCCSFIFSVLNGQAALGWYCWQVDVKKRLARGMSSCGLSRNCRIWKYLRYVTQFHFKIMLTFMSSKSWFSYGSTFIDIFIFYADFLQIIPSAIIVSPLYIATSSPTCSLQCYGICSLFFYEQQALTAVITIRSQKPSLQLMIVMLANPAPSSSISTAVLEEVKLRKSSFSASCSWVSNLRVLVIKSLRLVYVSFGACIFLSYIIMHRLLYCIFKY